MQVCCSICTAHSSSLRASNLCLRLQVLVLSALASVAAGLADANLPLESGRSRGDEHTAAAAEAGLGEENEGRLPVGTSGERAWGSRLCGSLAGRQLGAVAAVD